jgi:hypothetical protein
MDHEAAEDWKKYYEELSDSTATEANTTNPSQTSLVSAEFRAPAPKEVLKDDNFVENFRKFRRAFMLYLHLSGLSAQRDIIQVTHLLAHIGDACNDILENLDLPYADRNSVAKILEVLERAISVTDNCREYQIKLLSLKQDTGESILDFLDRLRTTARKCNLAKPVMDKLVEMKFMEGLRNDGLRRRIVRKRLASLQDMVDECTSSVSVNETNMSTTDSSVMAYQNVSGGLNSGAVRRFPTSRSVRGRGALTKPQGAGRGCSNCGMIHAPGRCFAYGKSCMKCGKIGHFQKMCRSTATVREVVQESEEVKQDEVVEYSKLECDGIETYDPTEFLYVLDSMSKPNRMKSQTGLEIQDKSGVKRLFRCLIDTGASVSIMSANDYERLGYRKEDISKGGPTLKGFGNGLTKPVGWTRIGVRFKGEERDVKFYIIVDDHIPIIGFEDVVALDLVRVMFTIDYEPRNKIFEKYPIVFSGIGKVPGKQRIVVQKPPPGYTTRQVPRRVPIHIRDELKSQLDEMERNSIIAKQESPTEWCHNLVLVKRNGKLRICLDPVPMNKYILREEFQIPTLDEVLPNLCKAKVFSICDAKSGFWQLELDNKSSILTTFWTPFGRYRWLRMLFGVSNAPEVFQRVMCELVTGLRNVVPLADDFLIYGVGDTMDEATKDHDKCFEAFLQMCASKNLKLNKDKVQFHKLEVKFFGHILTSQGVQADGSKIRAIVAMPAPTDCKAVTRFLGMVTFLGRYVKDLSMTSEPLRRLINAKEFVWEHDQEKSFEALKKLLTSAPILQYFDAKKASVVQCDASSYGLGAVLMQEGKELRKILK